MQQTFRMPSVKYLLSGRQASLTLKGLVGLLLAGVLYAELSARSQRAELWQAFAQQVCSAQIFWLALVLILLPLNWLAETQKWYPFVRRYEALTHRKAFQAVLAGVSISLFTPNRVGEYGGRLLFLQPQNHWRAVVANLIGNFSQMIVLFGAGIAGILYFARHAGFIDPRFLWPCAALALGGLLAMLLLYFNMNPAVQWAKKIPGFRRLKKWAAPLGVLRHFNHKELAEVLFWAGLRYGIYSVQYYCLLRFFGIPAGPREGFAGIATLFFFQTSIPLPPLTGLVARGNLAVYVWSFLGANEISSLAATFALWIINLILPALLGTFFIFHVNITKSLGYEDD